MPLPLALAVVPDAYVEPFDPIRDFKALSHLASWCLRFSPLAGLDYELIEGHRANILLQVGRAHYGVIIDLTGTEMLHGDLSRLASRLQIMFEGNARIALAPTVGAAWALSRYSRIAPPIVVSKLSAIQSALASLPVQALRIKEDTVKLLSDVGIVNAGDLFSLPRRSIAQRFGKHLLYRIEQALGALEERFHPVHAPKVFRSVKSFEPPITRRSNVVLAARYLFEDLLLQLSSAEKRAKYFQITITESDGRATAKELSLASATNSFSHFFTIVEPVIEAMRFFEEVSSIEVRADQIEDETAEQRTFSAGSEATNDSRRRQELLNNFAVRIGKDRLLRALLHQSHVPERSFSYDSILNENAIEKVCEPSLPYGIDERPSVIYPHPEPIATIAMLPDRPPSFVHWNNRKLRVLSGVGPERIAPEWWSGDLLRQQFSDRDYFKIQDEFGRWLWVYRDQKTFEWFIHGMWL